MNHALQCRCGTLKGEVAHTEVANRGVCYCKDCQAFARFLGRTGIMYEHGGTDIYQMAPSRVQLDRTESLACLRLSDKGMHRWYCSECKTTLGNTLGPKVPWIRWANGPP